MKNRAAIKYLLRCTLPCLSTYSTNFSDLIDLVVSCGGENLKYFLEKAEKNATYTSKKML